VTRPVNRLAHDAQACRLAVAQRLPATSRPGETGPRRPAQRPVTAWTLAERWCPAWSAERSLGSREVSLRIRPAMGKLACHVSDQRLVGPAPDTHNPAHLRFR